jgi:cobalt-zinc-cadmium efflux system outer membrane protein
MHWLKLAAAAAFSLAASSLNAQQTRVTRADAVSAAVARGPRLAIARADSAAARAQVRLARQFDNPIFGLAFTKSAPQQHFSVDVPLDYPWLRGARIGSAQAGLGAATYRFAFERGAVAYDADTTFTRALAAFAKARLSQRTALDADSLLSIARIRRDAGDASELDVLLASVNAGQLANTAALDSLEAISSLLAVQGAMGLNADVVAIVLADTLEALPSAARAGAAGSGTPLLLAAVEEDARSAELALTLERRRVFAAPAMSLGFESKDPTGAESGTLPTIGLSIPFPLFNQNGASVGAAQAQRDRALGILALARIEVNAALARARRAFVLAQERATRSQRLLAAANSVSALSLLAYREGAAALPIVLEAQRTARAAQTQYVDDVAAARNAAGLVTLLEQRTSTVNRSNP